MYYDPSVGSGGIGSKIIGTAFGAEIDKNIRDCYRFIVETFEKGDRLYFFGFAVGR